MSPDGKVAIVTGGTTGIGFSAACHLLKNCAQV
jgi:Dehydrogenases with different specificities (related to short-chain alcohol dehydrogenases)